jgi:putative transposase
VINRGNARAELFHKEEDLAAFVRIMGESCIGVPMRVVAYCLMPTTSIWWFGPVPTAS